MLSFSLNELYAMYAAYNAALGVWQLVAGGLMVLFAVLAFTGKAWLNRWISLWLALLWIWTGVVYHWLFYADVHAAAKYFAAGFVLQGLLIMYEGIKEKSLWFGYRGGACGVTGLLFVLYALVGYPILSLKLGHGYPVLAAFLLAPVPVTIYSLGLLLWTYKRVPEYLLIIPIVWSIVGTSVAAIGVYQDLGLLAAGLMSAIMIHRHNKVMKRNI